MGWTPDNHGICSPLRLVSLGTSPSPITPSLMPQNGNRYHMKANVCSQSFEVEGTASHFHL